MIFNFKSKKLMQTIVITLLASVSFTIIVFFPKQSDAIDIVNNKMISLGLIEQVKSAQELELNYLKEIPAKLDLALMDSVRLADITASQLPENGLIGIPLTTDGPVPVSNNTPALDLEIKYPKRFLAVASGNRYTGKVDPIQVKDVREMFTDEKRIGGFGGLSQANPKEQIIADASGKFLQARRPLVNDIVVFDTWRRKSFVIRDVFMSSVCRNAINAFLTRSYYQF
jgi:hypothetical protein